MNIVGVGRASWIIIWAVGVLSDLDDMAEEYVCGIGIGRLILGIYRLVD